MTNTLIIDTSYGSTVGVVGYEPIVETDSRTHVERLQLNVDRALKTAGLVAHDLDMIMVGVGPAPFTGLRAGIVVAQALAFALNIPLRGFDSLTPQSLMLRSGIIDQALRDGTVMPIAHYDLSMPVSRHYVLSLNDARRRQVYMALFDQDGQIVIPMDIDYPDHVVERVQQAVKDRSNQTDTLRIDVFGHGAARYAQIWQTLEHVGMVADVAALDLGASGLMLVDQMVRNSEPCGIEPLYLRRPDVSVPHPLKHVLGSGQADLANE